MGILVLVHTWVHIPPHLQYDDLLLDKHMAFKADHQVEIPRHNDINL